VLLEEMEPCRELSAHTVWRIGWIDHPQMWLSWESFARDSCGKLLP